MRFLMIAAALTVFAVPAFACDCSAVNTSTVLTDPTLTLADVNVRGYNTHNGQSMLEITNVRRGPLVARNIRAKFEVSDCGTIPSQKQMTLLIHNDDDGRYSIMGDCETAAAMKGQ